MELAITEVTFGVRPNVDMPDNRIFAILGESGIRELISNHYNCLFNSEIAHLFPSDERARAKAKIKSSDFFIQIFGGHPYYNENQGAPMMTRRHQPFKINAQARMTWLNCYRSVLLKLDLEDDLLLSFWKYLNIFSMWMVNTPED